MRDFLDEYVRLGTVFFVSYPEAGRDGKELLRRIRQHGADPDFEAVELTHIADKELRQEVIRACREAGLAVSYAAQGCLLGNKKNLNALVEEERQSAVALMKECIDEAYEMGAETMSFLAGTYEIGKEEAAMDALVASIKELCDYAKERGELQLAIEVFDYDLDKCSLIGPAWRVKELMERICPEKENFGALVDLSHFPQIHETVKESVLPVSKYIKQLHVGNCVVKKGCPRFGDLHPRYGYPNSAVDLPMVTEYLETLLKEGIITKEKRLIFSFEVKPDEGEDPDLVMASSKRMLRRAWRLAESEE